MQDLTIGILQYDQIWLNKDANFTRIKSLLELSTNFDLLLLPEMFHTGFSMDVSFADNWTNSSGLLFLKELAKIKQTAIYTSIMISKDAHYINRGVFIYPDGTHEIYDKRKAFGLGGEDQLFTTGDNEVIVNYLGWKLNLQICYDLRFPELVRNRLNEDGTPAYDAILNVANWPKKRISHWDALIKARAIENQCYFIACNRVGIDGNNLEYVGHSQAIDLLGNQLLTPLEHEALFIANCSADELIQGRKNLPFLKDV